VRVQFAACACQRELSVAKGELVGDEVFHRPADRHRVVVGLLGQFAALAVVQLERRRVGRQAHQHGDL
jgi:hypothetical protein